MPATTKYTLALVVAAAMTGIPIAQPQSDDHVERKTENKNVTVIEGQSSADGSSEVHREIIEDCIRSLPRADRLQPQITSQPVYLQEINGEAGHNGWVKSYTARLDVNYLSSEKEMIVITTRSVQAQPPVIKNVSKILQHTETFTSDPSEGGTFAGRSNRQYYFTTREDAIKDVQARAAVWIEQQKAVLCTAK